jgi:hypothetical protein
VRSDGVVLPRKGTRKGCPGGEEQGPFLYLRPMLSQVPTCAVRHDAVTLRSSWSVQFRRLERQFKVLMGLIRDADKVRRFAIRNAQRGEVCGTVIAEIKAWAGGSRLRR